jgi:hypothetical protein
MEKREMLRACEQRLHPHRINGPWALTKQNVKRVETVE